jgi:hypothetical protein
MGVLGDVRIGASGAPKWKIGKGPAAGTGPIPANLMMKGNAMVHEPSEEHHWQFGLRESAADKGMERLERRAGWSQRCNAREGCRITAFEDVIELGPKGWQHVSCDDPGRGTRPRAEIKMAEPVIKNWELKNTDTDYDKVQRGEGRWTFEIVEEPHTWFGPEDAS